MITLLQNRDKTETGYEVKHLLSDGTVQPWSQEYVWKSEYFKHFQPVAFIDTNDLEEAFEIHNSMHIHGHKVDKITERQFVIKTGDLLKNSKGEVFMVEPETFTKIKTA